MLKKQHEDVLTLIKTIRGMIADHPEEKSKDCIQYQCLVRQ